MSKTASKPRNAQKTAKHLVFVYGTLKRFNRNHFLLETSEFVGKASTEPRFKLLSAYGNAFPYLAPGDKSIIGEVFSVDDLTLQQLDRLEGYREGSKNNHYNRELIPVTVGGEVMDALVYTPNDLEMLSHLKEFEGNEWKSSY